jgi:F0F1-type ATP synthase assembly protein I
VAQRNFLLQLGLVTLTTAVLLWLFNRLPEYQTFAPFSWITLVFFTAFTLIAYFNVQEAAKSSNKHHFTNAFLGVTIVKLLFSAMLIVGYQVVMKPVSNKFVLPFFGVYLIYTIFETALLMKLGRTT